MIYDLKLSLPFWSFVTYDAEKRKAVKEQLERITNFEKRLSYFNSEIRSLATYGKQGAQIYYEWGNPDQKIKVFCNCNNCQSKPDFDNKQVKTYQKLRAKEIERLRAGIKQAVTYKDKLSFLFNTKGFIPDRTPAVWDNHNLVPLIELRPQTTEERAIYNQFVIEHFEKEYKDGKGFSKAYNGFDFEKEKERLNKRLLNSVTDKPVLLKYIKDEIEKHFNYPNGQNSNSNQNKISGHIVAKINKQLLAMGHIPNVFARVNLGEEIDLLGVTGLDSHSLLCYTNDYEIFRFYQYVKKLIEKPETIMNENLINKISFPNDNLIHEILDTPRMQNIFEINDFISIPNGSNPNERKPFEPIKKDAETNEDFEIIYHRELKLFNANDGTAFKNWLNKKVNDLLTYEQSLPANESVSTSKAQDICTRFLEWMNSKATNNLNSFSVNSIALMHVYLSMFGGKAITQQNKDAIALKYGFKNGTQLRNNFTKFQKEDKRKDLHTTNKKAANEHLQRFKDILPLLKSENIEAYNFAVNEFSGLEKIYNIHY